MAPKHWRCWLPAVVHLVTLTAHRYVTWTIQTNYVLPSQSNEYRSSSPPQCDNHCGLIYLRHQWISWPNKVHILNG